MKTIKALLVAMCMTFSARAASEPEPNRIILQVIAPVLPIWLNITVAGTNADITLVLEESGDLENWDVLLNIYPTITFFRLADWSVGGVDSRYYRGLSSAPAPEEMHRKWSDLGVSKYRYKLTAVQVLGLMSFAGIVTVSDGKVIEVTYPNSTVPVPEEDLPKYKTIDELFGIIFTQRPKAHVVTVVYDREWYFPSETYINYRQENSDADWHYQASDFELIVR